jgi:type I restriction enzyme S subunit
MTTNSSVAIWERVPIESVYEAFYDGPHATPEPASEGPVFLGIKNLTEHGQLDLSEVRHISEKDYPVWIRRVEPRPGDIVFTYEATLNRYAIIPEGFRGCLGRRLALIRPNPAKVDTSFLFYYFFGEDWRKTISNNIIMGATVDRIPLINFPKFEISLPPLPTQRKIAAILSAYDDLIANNTRRIALLEALAQALYREWFVHFRFSGHAAIPLVDSPLGPIPAGWGVGRLDDALILQRGFDLPTGQRQEGNVPVYAATGIVGTHNEARVKGPGIVTGRSGSLGTVLYVEDDYWPLNTALWVKEFRQVTPLYAFYLLSGLDLHAFNSGAAVPTLNRNDIHGLPVVLPPRTVLELFDSHVLPLFALKRSLQDKNANLRRTRDLLLPRLIAGAVDVSGLAVRIRGEDI